MEYPDAFSAYHPAVNFLYFVLVLLCAMCLMHPVSLAISLVTGLCYRLRLEGWKGVAGSLWYLLPTAMLAALLNPAFNHEGATILGYFPSGNPLTLESIVYGLAAAGLLASVLTWFGCYNRVMTSDKFVYLFGRVIPALSLVLSMTLRFVPRFKAKLQETVEAQRCAGRDISTGDPVERTAKAAAILSIVVTWSLENAVETADSMKSRGYGLPGRTAFSIYPFTRRDRWALGWLAFCGIFLGIAGMGKAFTWYYFPVLSGNMTGVLPLLGQGGYLALCLTPIVLDGKEEAAWRRLRSEI